MHGAVTVHMQAPAQEIWELVADVRNTGRFSPETFDARWLDGATGPALGARFRGHVKRNEIGPIYWKTCRVSACEPGREFGFAVYAGGRRANNWHYRLRPTDGGTSVTESFELGSGRLVAVYWFLLGRLRGRTNETGMRQTLERIKTVIEGQPAG